MARPTKYNKDMLPVLLECGKQGMGVVEMSAEIGICRDTFNEWRKANKEFSDTVKEAISYSQAWWEKLGRDGSTGEKQINATTWIFNMKNRFRDDWRDKQEIDQTTKVSVVEIPTEF